MSGSRNSAKGSQPMPSTYPLESNTTRGWERRMTKVMFAVIKSGGRQYKVSVGQTLEVNRLPVEVGEQVHFNEVLLISYAVFCLKKKTYIVRKRGSPCTDPLGGCWKVHTQYCKTEVKSESVM